MTTSLMKLADSLTWQDIETADKDSDCYFLLKEGEHVTLGFYHLSPDHPSGDGWCDIDDFKLFSPTHWMPIPTGNAGEVIQVLVEAVQYYQHLDPEGWKAQQALARAEELASEGE